MIDYHKLGLALFWGFLSLMSESRLDTNLRTAGHSCGSLSI